MIYNYNFNEWIIMAHDSNHCLEYWYITLLIMDKHVSTFWACTNWIAPVAVRYAATQMYKCANSVAQTGIIICKRMIYSNFQPLWLAPDPTAWHTWSPTKYKLQTSSIYQDHTIQYLSVSQRAESVNHGPPPIVQLIKKMAHNLSAIPFW